MRSFVLLLMLSSLPLVAQEWPIELALDRGARQGFDLDPEQQLAIGDQLAIDGDWAALPQTVWLELALLTNDERYYASAMPLEADPDRDQPLRVPLAAWAWSGPDGLLDDDTLHGVRRLWIRPHGTGDLAGSFRGTLRTERASGAGGARRRVQLLAGGTVRHGGWRELRFRFLGQAVREEHRVDLVLADGRRIPCFASRRLAPHLGRLRVRGPGFWVARLRADEAPTSGWRIEVGDWRSSAMPAVPPVDEPLPPVAVDPLPTATPAAIDHLLVIEPGEEPLRRAVAVPAAVAPHLRWREDWSGFRGPELSSHLAAAHLDAALFAGAEAVDLLPQSLFEEQGTFRFGLSPWHRDHGGSWRWPQDLFRDQDAVADLIDHARDVIARCRASPELTNWRVSCRVSANDPEQRERLVAIVRRLRTLLAADSRALVVDHPQAVPYDPRRIDGDPWLSFERDTEGFSTRGPLQRSGDDPSHGRMALRVPLAAGAGGINLLRDLDANVFNLDRLEFDARLDGDGGLQLYCWVTDEHHRWYQQRLTYLRAGEPWRTVGVDFSAHSEWQPVGHETAWDGSQRRRLRRIGLMGFPHQRSVDGHLDLDRFVRFGWPATDEPELALVALAPDATRLRCHDTLSVDFQLSVPCQNPYDPDHADVVGEVIAPDGTRFTHPAYWYEAVDLAPAETGRHEQVTRSDQDGWRWHLSPDAPGEWRWRIVAKVERRERWLETAGEWRTLTVAEPEADALLPVRRSADPRYFERSDGSWFYPIGMNVRSPGDERQDDAIADAGLEIRSHHFERMGTAAFDHWFERMADHGMNYARVWMSPWFCGLEWTRAWDGYGGLTVYNQIHAAQLDQVMAAAGRHGIYIQLELQNHGMTAPRVDSQWEDNPYNARLGGPCRGPDDFFTDEAAWAAHVKRLRYTIARWGHHSNLMCWVLSSEMEFTGAWWEDAYRQGAGGHSERLERWIRRSIAWLREHDRSQRPTSVHFSHPWRAVRLWREVEELGFNYSNAYTGFREIAGPEQRLDLALLTYLDQKFPPWRLERPTLIGEWGGHWVEKSSEILDAELRAGTWMQAVLPYGGNTGFWWWLWVDATDNWGDYAAVARFLADEDPRGRNFRSMRPDATSGQARILGMSGRDQQRYYAWRIGSTRKVGTAPVDGGSAVLRAPAGSRWRVRRYDCATGTVTAETELTAGDDGQLVLKLGHLDPDAAFKLDRLTGVPVGTGGPSGSQ